MKTKLLLSLLFLLSLSSMKAQIMLKDVGYSTGSHPMNFTRAGEYVYFVANDNLNGHNFELWKTDGTESGTVMVKDINPSGSGVGESYGFVLYLPVASPLHTIGSEIYFFADDYFHGYELWKSNGTDAGTQMVIDLDSSSTSSIQDLNHLNYPPTTLVYKNKIYFTATSLTLGQRIWVSDGTANGTHPLLAANNQYFTSGTYPVIYDSVLYFFTGSILNRTDGTQQGTYSVYNPNTPVFFNQYTKLGNKFFMSGTADQFSGDFELWTMDETGTATLIKDINPGLGESDPHNFIAFNGKVYFWANDVVHGDELWTSDGTTSGTELVKDLNPGIQGSTSGFDFIPAILNNKFYFYGNSADGALLWQSDGTATGTVPVTDPSIVQPYSGTLEINQLNFQVVGNYLYFPGYNAATGVELWRTNGTSVGMMGEISPGGGWGPSGEYNGYNGKFYFDGQNIYFAGNDSVHHEEPWILDPNAIGISDVKNNAEIFTVYPNPTTDFFYLNFSSRANDLTIKLCDFFGREVRSINHFSQSQITVGCEKLPAGLYSVTVSDRDQKILYSGKVILE